MIDLGIEVFDLSDSESAAYHDLMVDVHNALVTISINVFGDGSPSNIIRLLDDPPAAATHWIVSINHVATRILGGYIRTVVPLISSCHLLTKRECSSADESDFVQEAKLCIYYCMFTFDGSHEFSTYIYSCVKRRLNSYGRQCVRQSSVLAHTKRLGKSVKQLTGKGVSVATATALVHGQTLVDEPSYYDTLPDDPSFTELQLRAVREADLGPLERYVIDAHLAGVKPRDFRLQTHNPATNKPYSRVSLCNAFNSAARKIRAKMQELQQRSEAA